MQFAGISKYNMFDLEIIKRNCKTLMTSNVRLLLESINFPSHENNVIFRIVKVQNISTSPFRLPILFSSFDGT